MASILGPRNTHILLQQSNQTHTHTLCNGTKSKSDLFRNWYALIQFNLELIETCVLETCGQITKENEISLDLIELYWAMKKPIIESALHPSSKWRQVIRKRHAPQIQLTRIKGKIWTTHTEADEKTKSSISVFQKGNWKKLWNHCTTNALSVCKQAQFKGHDKFKKYTHAHTVLTNTVYSIYSIHTQ